MFLKKIALHGFKSFADRTEFEFGAGITSIVGPNGCGKSNILDALRWVLGEQSARQLRGHKMADVVFSGSRGRRPASFAEVEITFDNSQRVLLVDEPEVTVGRTLLASGDSEYRLNGNICRLRDIRELLLDTGVGVDAYSIIEQGRVDAMLQANPIERREIFEEAAGISRYKVRRVEAQRKLERTEQNLLRLNDVIDELDRRLRSVRLAAGKARNFQQYDARLRELRAVFSLAEYHDLEQRRERVEAELRTHADRAAGKRGTLARCDADAAELAHAIHEQDARIADAERALQTILTEQSALLERAAAQERRAAEQDALAASRRAHAAELEAGAGALAGRLDVAAAALRALSSEESELQERVAAARQAGESAEARRDEARRAVDQERQSAFDVSRRCALLANDIANIEQQQQRIAAQRGQLDGRREAAAATRVELVDKHAAAARDLAQVDELAAAASERVREADARISAAGARVETLRRDAAAQTEARAARLSRLDLLEELERNCEGVDAGARSVLGWRQEAPEAGVLGLVADLLRLDDEPARVLRGALAEIESLVVVRSAHDFLAALARSGAPSGALRVIALDRLTPLIERNDYAGAPGVRSRAADLVRCDDALRPLAEALLGRVLLVDELERGLALAGGAGPGWQFVAPDGRRACADGRLHVGGSEGGGGLISRKAEIRGLRLACDEIEAELDLLSRALVDAQRERGEAELQREALLSEVASLQRRGAELRSDLSRADDEAQRVSRELVYLDGELSAAQVALEELERRLLAARAERDERLGEAQSAEARLGACDDALRSAAAAADSAARELTELLVELGRASERRRAADAALEHLRAQAAEQARQAGRAAEEAGQAVAAAHDSRGAAEAARSRHAELDTRREMEERGAVQLREARLALRTRLEACSAAVKELHADIEECEALVHESQATLRETAVRREALASRVQDELGVSLASLYESYEHADQDWEAIKAEIEELRGKIARLGNVNLDAIAELEELAPRHENLVAQRQDLLDAVTRLTALIEELDAESRTRFAATFETIRGHFQELFRKLFGGGKADVILEQPESPLESGIEIVARPPGKEPQSISLLSGGEKTMTAVALLLAVFRSKPSPFTVLDEVDAALDEANVGRFNTVLREFLDQTQFVVITHHKRTMQSSDVLYGITMEEPGVSKRVAVKFDDATFTSV
ncbi:MAG: chromosome segregation protein SMC [Planctomycetia bacterium]|nr:MAG: chromosome segregation protein SMC [Planctomycetia bacterium]